MRRMKTHLEKVGSFGALIAAAAYGSVKCPPVQLAGAR